jgi:hypothetical protein
MLPERLIATMRAALSRPHAARFASCQENGGESSGLDAAGESLRIDRMAEQPPIRVEHLYISPGHNFFGHHERPPGTYETVEQQEIVCLAGRGIEVTASSTSSPTTRADHLFRSEIYEELCARFGVRNKEPSAFRRNVITRGADLNALIGKEFAIQGVRFLGTTECSPCYWMDAAFHAGAEAALKGRGGLRAKILSSGTLRVDPA